MKDELRAKLDSVLKSHIGLYRFVFKIVYFELYHLIPIL